MVGTDMLSEHSRGRGFNIEALSVKELKAVIVRAGLSYNDCVEKVDLIARARQAERETAIAPASRGSLAPETVNTASVANHCQPVVPQVIARTRPVRILALHGFNGSGHSLQRSLRWHQRLMGDTVLWFCPDAPAPCASWEFLEVESTRDLHNIDWLYERSRNQATVLAYLRGIWIRDGPFDGIAGYSQGATVAARFAADAPTSTFPTVRFAILGAGTAGWVAAINEERVPSNACSVPSLHFYGAGDRNTPPELSEQLAAFFHAPRRHPHSGRHVFMPRTAAAVRDLADLLREHADLPSPAWRPADGIELCCDCTEVARHPRYWSGEAYCTTCWARWEGRQNHHAVPGMQDGRTFRHCATPSCGQFISAPGGSADEGTSGRRSYCSACWAEWHQNHRRT